MLDAHQQFGSYGKKFMFLGLFPPVLVAEELLKWLMKQTFKLQFLMFVLFYFLCVTFDSDFVIYWGL